MKMHTPMLKNDEELQDSVNKALNQAQGPSKRLDDYTGHTLMRLALTLPEIRRDQKKHSH